MFKIIPPNETVFSYLFPDHLFDILMYILFLVYLNTVFKLFSTNFFSIFVKLMDYTLEF